MEGEWPSGRTRPLRRSGSSTVEIDENLALYDDVGQLLILLNTSAAIVWRLCDGCTTLDDMVRALIRSYPEQATGIADDVRQTVRKLAELGLVVDANPETREEATCMRRPDPVTLGVDVPSIL